MDRPRVWPDAFLGSSPRLSITTQTGASATRLPPPPRADTIPNDWSWCFLHMPVRMACLVQPSIKQSFFLAPWAIHLPPCTATLVQPSASHRFRAGPCVLHKPAFLTFLVQPGYLHVLRLAPCEMHNPPCTTRFGQPSTVHFRRILLLAPPWAKRPADEERGGGLGSVLRGAAAFELGSAGTAIVAVVVDWGGWGGGAPGAPRFCKNKSPASSRPFRKEVVEEVER